MPKGEIRSYPGFLKEGKHPQGFAMPCCFKDNSKRVSELFNSGVMNIVKSDSLYVQTWGRQLSKDRMGLLPERIYTYFENAALPITGQISQSKGSNWF